jgi:putative redox protein
MKIHLKRQNQALHFEAINPDGNTIQLDSGPSYGGEGKGMRPMELLLAGLAGCSAIDIGLILQKQKQDIQDFQIEVTAERREEIPRIFTEINLHYILKGKIDAPKIERAIALSMEKYCSATEIISKTANIHTSFTLNDD